MEKEELNRLVQLSLEQNQKMFEELLKVLELNIKDDKLKLLRVYSEQNKGLLEKISEITKH